MINEPPKEGNAPLEKYSEQKKPKKTSFFWIASKVYTINLFYFTVFVLLAILGITVVALTVSGNIQPLWLATALSMLASISTMFGLYGIYSLLHNANAVESLVKDAIHRVIHSKN